MYKAFKTKEGKEYKVEFEKCNYNNVFNSEINPEQIISGEIDSILKDSWGSFPSNFLEKHIFDEKCRIIIAKYDNESIGFCVLNFKNICGMDIHYIEFLVIKKNFQNFGLGSYLFYLILQDEIKRNFFKLLFKPLEIVFITPNIKTITQISKFAKFLYPNPYLAHDDGSIGIADENSWKIARHIISNSDNPRRILYREGLVLEGSYLDAPWLVFHSKNAPWHFEEKVNKFAKRYLGYESGEGKEFVVHARIDSLSVIKYLIHSLF